MSNEVKFSLTAAQLKIAKKVATEEMQSMLTEEMCNVARRVARKYVKENKAKIETEAKAKLEKAMKNNVDEIVNEAMKRTHLFLVDTY